MKKTANPFPRGINAPIKPADLIRLRKDKNIDKKENLISFLRKSPLNGLNLAIRRNRSTSRVVDL